MDERVFPKELREAMEEPGRFEVLAIGDYTDHIAAVAYYIDGVDIFDDEGDVKIFDYNGGKVNRIGLNPHTIMEAAEKLKAYFSKEA